MENSLFYLPHGGSLPDEERLAAAQRLAEQLPVGFVFRGLETYSLGSQSHKVAFFDWNPDNGLSGKFALIPGGEVTLGYDPDHPFVPSPAQKEDWQETQEEYETPDLDEFLDGLLTPRRTVTLKPFLMEIDVQDTPSLVKTIVEDRAFGFRLPTSDEWEWACGAGARTLWRWGDDCPMDGYPCDHRTESSPWNLHRLPNAFGLHIADDDYHQELCEGGIVRGGNGGGFTCGGVGYLAAWVTLATAYFSQGQEGLENLEYCQARRVFSL